MNKQQDNLLTEARLLMLRRMPYFGIWIMSLRMEEDLTMPTAATDGRRIRFNPNFVLGGNDGRPLRPRDEVIFINAHEVLHCCFKHMLRYGWRHKGLANVAADLAINIILVDGQIGRFPDTVLPGDKPLPRLVDEKYRGMSFEEIYDLLKKEHDKQGGGDKLKMPGGVILDLSQDDPGGLGGFEKPTNDDGTDLSETDQARLDRELDGRTATAAAAAKRRGTLPAGLERLIDTMLKPKIDWRAYLRTFVAKTVPTDYSWQRPHRRYMAALDLYLPYVEKSGCGSILVIMDTSGSVAYHNAESEGAQYFSEIKAIVEDCNPEMLHVMYCDAAVAGYDVFQQGEEPMLKPRGGGGTDFRPPFKKVEKEGLEIQCAIYLTDGYGPFPEKPLPYPVLWVITSDVKAPWGETLRLEL